MGTPIILYMNAQKRFWRMVRTVSLESCKASVILVRSEEMIVILATSIAISLPLPIAMLRSA